jgi:hypothetical protein
MVAKGSSNLDLVNKWYVDFRNRDFDAVVSVFADDAILTIGDGDSEGAVAYGGRFVGIEQIKYFYAVRFMNPGIHPLAVVRPECAITTVEQEFGRWVIIGSEIHDRRSDLTVYKGRFMHVWSINPADSKVASLSMFFDVDAVP